MIFGPASSIGFISSAFGFAGAFFAVAFPRAFFTAFGLGGARSVQDIPRSSDRKIPRFVPRNIRFGSTRSCRTSNGDTRLISSPFAWVHVFPPSMLVKKNPPLEAVFCVVAYRRLG